jgi:hypothetical protein
MHTVDLEIPAEMQLLCKLRPRTRYDWGFLENKVGGHVTNFRSSDFVFGQLGFHELIIPLQLKKVYKVVGIQHICIVCFANLSLRSIYRSIVCSFGFDLPRQLECHSKTTQRESKNGKRDRRI